MFWRPLALDKGFLFKLLILISTILPSLAQSIKFTPVSQGAPYSFWGSRTLTSCPNVGSPDHASQINCTLIVYNQSFGASHLIHFTMLLDPTLHGFDVLFFNLHLRLYTIRIAILSALVALFTSIGVKESGILRGLWPALLSIVIVHHIVT